MQKGNCPSGCDCLVRLVKNPFSTAQTDIFYCDNCGMFFWYNSEHYLFKEKSQKFWEDIVNNSLKNFCLQNEKLSFNFYFKQYVRQYLFRIKEKITNITTSLSGTQRLLKEQCYFKSDLYPYSLHLDSKEKNHKHEVHIHFYYGKGKNMPRSIGYDIYSLTPEGIEKDKHFKKNCKKFKKFLELVKKWLDEKDEKFNGMTGREIIIFAWKNINK